MAVGREFVRNSQHDADTRGRRSFRHKSQASNGSARGGKGRRGNVGVGHAARQPRRRTRTQRSPVSIAFRATCAPNAAERSTTRSSGGKRLWRGAPSSATNIGMNFLAALGPAVSCGILSSVPSPRARLHILRAASTSTRCRSRLSAAVPPAAGHCISAAGATRSNWEALGSAGSGYRRSTRPAAYTICAVCGLQWRLWPGPHRMGSGRAGQRSDVAAKFQRRLSATEGAKRQGLALSLGADGMVVRLGS